MGRDHRGVDPAPIPRARSERGAVAAELAVALPAVVLVLIAVLVVVLAGLTQMRVADAARAGARAAAAGEDRARVVEIARHLAGPDASVEVDRADPWVTVRVGSSVSGTWFMSGMVATAEATAWLEESFGAP